MANPVGPGVSSRSPTGWSLGAEVGGVVELFPGSAVGLRVVGSNVGSVVVPFVGNGEGMVDGSAVVSFVGDTEGWMVSSLSEGEMEGDHEGVTEGSSDGVSVAGSTVSDWDGASVC